MAKLGVGNKYATETGEVDVSSVRARAVGNAVYLEHIGGSGDIATWAMPNRDSAAFVAGEINLVVNAMRSQLGDAAAKAGSFAYEAGKAEAKLREMLIRFLGREGQACRIDHNGFCQNHLASAPCYVAGARELVRPFVVTTGRGRP